MISLLFSVEWQVVESACHLFFGSYGACSIGKKCIFKLTIPTEQAPWLPLQKFEL